MPSVRLLCRAAVRLRDIYSTRAVHVAEQTVLDRLGPYRRALDGLRVLVRQAVSDEGAMSCLTLRRQLHALVAETQATARRTCQFVQEARPVVPELRSFMEELRQLEDEFDGVEVDLKRKLLAVTTGPITLEEIYLGRFTVQLTWTELIQNTSSNAFDVVALDANPPANNDGVTHPHVKSEKLCAGDASSPVKLALEQGRLVDAFCLVRSVLTTYNPGSAYVALEHWEGCTCCECGYEAGSDDLYGCERCENDFCS
ncbi:MAG: hypothetical protein HY040_24240, partial [Planctomycetes bacterium]|nr:hypothetical protein [Planctomycetota bacterium]